MRTFRTKQVEKLTTRCENETLRGNCFMLIPSETTGIPALFTMYHNIPATFERGPMFVCCVYRRFLCYKGKELIARAEMVTMI